MKKLLCFSIFLLGFCAALFAQDVKTVSCPEIEVSGPSGIIEPGGTGTFTATVDISGSENLIYNWTTSIGEIVEGQGTNTITVKIPKNGSENLTATVEIKGLPEGCPKAASESVGCGLRPPHSEKIDEFGKATNGNVKMRFDNFMVNLQNDPTAQGYILNYGSAKEISKRDRQIRNAIAFRNFDAQRITVVNGGGEGEVKTQFWIVPAGATPPTP